MQMFEGIAVGIQNNPTRALNLTMAVLLHKWAEALTLVFIQNNIRKT